jgi:hypothetical protein
MAIEAGSRRFMRLLRGSLYLILPPILAASSVASRSLEVDHVFVLVSRDGEERKALSNLGFVDTGHVAHHEEDGTASIGYVFDNANLELLWIEDEDKFRAANRGSDASMSNRVLWRDTGASPFGVGLRRRAGAVPGPLPFPTHRVAHPNGVKQLSGVAITTRPVHGLSSAARGQYHGRVAYQVWTRSVDGVALHGKQRDAMGRFAAGPASDDPLLRTSETIFRESALRVSGGS